MVGHFKKRVSQTSLALSRDSGLASKLKFRSRGRLPSSSLKPLKTIEWKAPSPALLKARSKRSALFSLLKQHQRDGAMAAASISGYALLFAQRTGKTWATGAVLELSDDHDVLIVGPKTNIESTWAKFLGEKLPSYTVCRSLEEYRAHQKEFEKAWGHRDHCILLLNYEQLPRLISKLVRIPWDRVVYDEAHRLKNRNSAASRAAAKLRHVKTRLALTGTPQDLSSRDLWAIMRFVAPEVFGDSWPAFEEEYLQKPNIDPRKARGAIARKKAFLALMIARRKMPMREDMLDQFTDKLRPHVMRISKEDAGMKGARIHRRGVEMVGRQRRLYDQLEKTMVAKWNGQKIVTALKITQMAKLQQIAGGFIYDEDHEVHRVGNAKLDLLEQLIEKHVDDEHMAIFCKYKPEIEMIEKRLRRMGYRRIAKLWGKVKDTKHKRERTQLLLDFQEGKYDAIIAQQRTGGVGVDLFKARKGFVYSMGHSFIDYDQMMSRMDFMAQDEQADFFLLYSKRSIDEDIISAVKLKTSVANVTYERLNRHRRIDMAKTKETETKAKGKAKAESTEDAEAFKYGVSDLAELMELKPASVRVQLRNKKVKKAGKSYGWNTKGELKEVAEKLGAGKPEADEPKPKGKAAAKADTKAKGKKRPAADDDD